MGTVNTTPGDRTAPDPVPLSTALREGSRREHEDAEASGFVADLLAGRSTAGQYAAYLQRLRVVYTALEDAVRAHADHPAVAPLHDEALSRLPALEQDLAHWAPEGDGSTPSGAAEAYRRRIELARAHPVLLVAHHYTRYLGDLSGGRMLAGALRSRHGADGLAFYDFPGVPKPVTYKRAYRDRLDALPVGAAERAALVEEVRCAFRLNRELLDEVAALAEVTPRCPV